MSDIDAERAGLPVPRGRFRQWPIQVVLLVVIGGLAAATSVAVGLGFYIAALRNADALVGDLARTELLRIEDALDSQLRPAQEQSAYLADLLAKGSVKPSDYKRVRDLLLGSIAAIGQLEAVAFIAPDFTTIWATAKGETGEHFSAIVDVSAMPTMRQILVQAEERRHPYWSAPMMTESGPSEAMLVAVSPIERDGKFAGAIGAGVSLRAVSERMAGSLGGIGSGFFVMTADGRIIFHSGLSLWPSPLPGQTALPDRLSFVDPVLKAMEWPPSDARDWSESAGQPNAVEDLHTFDVEEGGRDHIVGYRVIRNYGQIPWVVGLHISRSQASNFLSTLNRAIPFAAAMLAIALGVSVWLGRAIARPIRELASESLRLAQLEFDERPEPETIMREIWEAARAQRQMRNGLRWLSQYMPKSLLPALMRAHGSLRSRQAEVAVLFSDIVGFSSIAEDRDADRVASLLNKHFGMLGACIEAEGGTIDKYMGDSVMAYWGAPIEQEDFAERAQRAASTIARRIAEDNKKRAAEGLRPIRIRLGLHKGPAVVGNIGAPGRVNYTLIGDTVNIAQRLEQFGHEIDDGKADAVVVASKEMAETPAAGITWISLGQHVLPGRSSETEIFLMRLD